MKEARIQGGCHCGAVRFEVISPLKVTVQRCNCSICKVCGYLHLIVPANRFRLLSGQKQLTEYRFNTGVARHFFCEVCGIKSFYVPRSNPNGYSVNANCMEWPENSEITEEQFDGKNFELNVSKLRHLSIDDH